MELQPVFATLSIAVGLGLLVGLQRERAQAGFGGIRTFPLVTLLGALCGLLAQRHGGLVVAGGFLGVVALVVTGSLAPRADGQLPASLTSKAALLLMYATGAFLVEGPPAAAIAVAAGTAALLQFKGTLHGLAKRLGDDDLKAIVQFALISLVVLPVLPDRAYGPYAVLNPHHMWLMVVLIAGIGLGGWVAGKLFGERVGTLASGILGGLVSSTATTLAQARRVREAPELAPPAATIVALASAVVFARMLVEIAIVGPGLLAAAAPPLLACLAALLVAALALGRRLVSRAGGLPARGNPTELGSAIGFGLVYGAVLLAVAAAREHFGSTGLLAVAGLSGLTDVDALTLSTARLVESGRLAAAEGSRLVLAGALANLGFKAALAGIIAGGPLLGRITIPFAALLAAGALWIAAA